MARGRDALDDTVAVPAGPGQPGRGRHQRRHDGPRRPLRPGFGEVGDRWGSLNVLVHTIGPGAGRFDDLDDAGWDEAFALGTMSAVRSVREAVPLLRAAEWARVAIFSAHSIQRQSPMLVAYTASKAAVTSLAKNLAKSLGPRRHPRQCGVPRLHRDGELHREPPGDLRRRGPRPVRSARRHDSGSARPSTSPPISGGPACPTRSRPSPPTSCPAATAT